MSRKATTFFLILIFLASALLLTYLFRPEDIFKNTPVYDDDFSMHYAQCISTKRFLSRFGKCWAYDPFFLAGLPRGILVNADNKAWELFYFVLSPLFGGGFAFKLYIILTLLLYPFFIYGAARNFNLPREQSLIAAVLAILFFNLSLPIDFVSWGLASYILSSHFSIFVLSLFYRLFEQFTWKRYVAATLSSSLLLLMHALAPIPVLIPVIILYLCYFKRIRLLQHAMMLVMVGIVVGINSYWLFPFIDFSHYITKRPENYEFALQIKNVFAWVKRFVLQRRDFGLSPKIPALNNTFIDIMLLVFGICGCYIWYRKRQISLLLSFSVGMLLLFLLTYYGSHNSKFAIMQPERFTLPFNLFMMVPAAVGLFYSIKSLCHERSAISILFIGCLAFVIFYRPIIKPFGLLYLNRDLYRLNCTFPEQANELLDFFEKETTREGRILIEDSEYSPEDPEHQYYGAHLSGLFPEYVKREYLCGPRAIYPMVHSYASYTRGILFERNINSFSREDLEKFFNVYNVKWIVCWLKESKKTFSRFPGYIRKMAEIDKFTIYEVHRKPTFFIKGSGTVHADYNRLELKNLVAKGGEIIISYHWMKDLKSIPALKIDRYFLAGDPVGFIRIKNPPESIVLKNDY